MTAGINGKDLPEFICAYFFQYPARDKIHLPSHAQAPVDHLQYRKVILRFPGFGFIAQQFEFHGKPVLPVGKIGIDAVGIGIEHKGNITWYFFIYAAGGQQSEVAVGFNKLLPKNL